MNDTKRRPILIFGMDRSGTSLVGNLVSKWGAYGGELLGAIRDIHNPNGYYEDLELQDLVGEHIGNEFLPGHDERLAERARTPAARAAFERYFEKMGGAADVWFIKEPTLGLNLPFFETFFDDPVCVITVRNPYESAVSWQKFLMPPDCGLQIVSANLLRWQYLMTSTLRNVQGKKKMFLSFEELHGAPESAVRKLANFLDGCYGRHSDESVITHMLGAVDRKLYRNRTEVDFLEYPDASLAQKALYAMLRTALDDADRPFDVDSLTLPAGWSEHINNANELAALAHADRRGFVRRLLDPVAARLEDALRKLVIRFAVVRTVAIRVQRIFA